MFQDFKSEIKLFLIVALVAVVLIVGGILLLKTLQSAPLAQITSPASTPELLAPETSVCSSTEIEGYSYQIPEGTAYYDSGYNGEVRIDLNGDGKQESLRAYIGLWQKNLGDIEMPTARPIIIKVFSGPEDCQKEVFHYQGAWDFARYSEAFSNPWDDGANAVLVEEQNRSFASGTKIALKWFTYRDGKYQVIEGPQLGGFSLRYKFDGENGLGKKIITAENWWDGDYCAGCASRLQFLIYTWNGEGYDRTEAGITQDKYFSQSIDEILAKEPNVLNPQ